MTPLRDLIQSHGHAGFYRKVVDLLNEKQLTPDDFSYHELAAACGVLPRLKGLRESQLSLDSRLSSVDATTHLLSETGSAVGTTLFQVVTGELISRKVIEGYEDDTGFIGDKLVTVLPSKIRNARIAGFKALGGPNTVTEGSSYDESTFAEKFVTTSESKKGRILSITEELIAFDQTGGHTRPGEDESVALSFSAKWTQLISRSHSASDPLALYETLMFEPGTGLQSTSQPGEQSTLTLEFTVTDPAGQASEKIVFSKVYRESLTMSEGEKSNLIAFTGRSFSTAPAVTRI